MTTNALINEYKKLEPAVITEGHRASDKDVDRMVEIYNELHRRGYRYINAVWTDELERSWNLPSAKKLRFS